MDFGFWSRASRDQARQRVGSVGAEAVLYCVTCADDVMRSRVLTRTAEMPEGAPYIDERAIAFRTQYKPLAADEAFKPVRTDS